MEYKLLPYQGPALEFLKCRPRAALFAATGAGKTLISLLHIKRLNKRTLVVCEATKKHIWTEDNVKFGIDLNISTDWHTDAPVNMVSYDWLKENAEYLDDFEVVIFDEAHCIAEPTTLRYRNLFEKVKSKQHVILLAGYPVENHLQEIFVVSLITDVLGRSYDKFLTEHSDEDSKTRAKSLDNWMTSNYQCFLNRYFHIIRKNGRIVRIWPKPDAMDNIIWAIRDIAFVVKKSEVMPAGIKNETVITRFELSDEQKGIIQDIFQDGEYRGQPVDIRCKNTLVAYSKSMQLMSGFVYNTVGEEEIYPVPLLNNPKLDLLDKLVAGKENFLIWYLFDYEYKQLKKYEGVAKLCKLQTDSRGLNLQSYKFAIYYTIPLSGGQYMQSIDRVYRYGRTADVLSVVLLPKGEVGDWLSKMLNRKQKLTKKFIDRLFECKV